MDWNHNHRLLYPSIILNLRAKLWVVDDQQYTCLTKFENTRDATLLSIPI